MATTKIILQHKNILQHKFKTKKKNFNVILTHHYTQNEKQQR